MIHENLCSITTQHVRTMCPWLKKYLLHDIQRTDLGQTLICANLHKVYVLYGYIHEYYIKYLIGVNSQST